MRPHHVSFAVDRQGAGIVTCCLARWPHLDQATGTPLHFPFDMLAEHDREFACRTLGSAALGCLACFHRDAMAPYVFAPIPLPLADPISKVERRMPDCEAVLPIHVAIGLSDDGQSLEFCEHDDAHQALPGTVRSMTLRALEALEPDGTAPTVGGDVLDTLMRLYPAVFAPYPQLAGG